MSNVKRLDLATITSNFDLKVEGDDLLYKPLGTQPFSEKAPYRTETYGIALVYDGEVRLNADLKEYQIKGPSIIVMGPEIIRQWFSDGKSIKTVNVFFKEEFLVSGKSDVHFLKKFEFFGKTGIHHLTLDESQFKQLGQLFVLIEGKFNGEDKYRFSVIRSIIEAILYEIEEIYQLQYTHEIHQLSQSELLTRNFKDLLSRSFHEYRAVQFYADSLFVNAKHLSQTLKDETGKTASEWINEMVMLEAKVLLQDDSLTVNQITYQLNFADPSFFGKFFKRHEGKSPRQYRLEKA